MAQPTADGSTRGPLLKEELTPVRLAKVVVIQHSYPDLYDLLKLTPRYLRDLEAYFGAVEVRAKVEVEAEEQGEQRARLPGALEPFGQVAGLRRLFKLFPGQDDACFGTLTPTQLRIYLTLAGRAESEQPAEAEQATRIRRGRRRDFEPELVQIPAGEFLMGSTEEEVKQGLAEENETSQHPVQLPAFEIGRYPITNLEYRTFVEATGHEPPSHWERGQFPEDLADHPITNVSWNDAVAYCRWLSEMTNEIYRLPSEAEWEYAARGSDGRRYPWGNAFDKDKCNTEEAGIGATTPVGQYSPAGDSPFGCADLIGNVWEWCSTIWTEKAYPFQVQDEWTEDYLEKRERRVLRGGSFYNDQKTARAAFRYYIHLFRDWDRGFRVVRAWSPSSPLQSDPSEL